MAQKCTGWVLGENRGLGLMVSGFGGFGGGFESVINVTKVRYYYHALDGGRSAGPAVAPAAASTRLPPLACEGLKDALDGPAGLAASERGGKWTGFRRKDGWSQSGAVCAAVIGIKPDGCYMTNRGGV